MPTLNLRYTPVIVSAVRTPTGKFMGGLSSLTAPQLGAIVIREAVRRAGIDPASVDEVIMGNVVSAGIGQAPARQAAIHGRIPPSVPCLTINKMCGSGLKAVMLAAQAIKAGDANIIVAGGMESMSNTPHLLTGVREGYRLGHQQVLDSVIHDGLWCAFCDFHMGEAAEVIAERFAVSRQEQDEFALQSHRKAVAAIKAGAFTAETIPVDVPHRKGGSVVFDTDEVPRSDTSLEQLAALKPVFRKDGTVTAGNAPGLNDGASALVIMSQAAAAEAGITPLARITGYAAGGTEPAMIFYAPVIAVNRLLEKLDVPLRAFDLIEINEAFSAQVLADSRELRWDWDRVNVHGGAVALGHPVGASGARVLTTLLYAMQRRDAKTGLATLCLGGGNAVALSVERVT
ncbi:MAG: acetyl-CoA C-acetyltransferase [Candidatus Latescibacteria bacterium]|nr:acetyl-CoA C-acetyltransferase [Candidatus Latescibacterota bacterium]